MWGLNLPLVYTRNSGDCSEVQPDRASCCSGAIIYVCHPELMVYKLQGAVPQAYFSSLH